MRVVALAPLVVAIMAAPPASAQTYSPDYPVCLHVFGPATYFDCRYTSIAQCNLSASGRAAQCVTNPYRANAGIDESLPPVRYHHHRHRYY
jgi:Protein of unknown function (DUF3551)